MKKKCISFYCITLMVFCQVFICGAQVGAVSEGLSEEQKVVIVHHCDTIKEDLKNLQHSDSKARVYLGRYYETILTKFITPLNVRLVENNLSDNDLIENQNAFAAARAEFVENFVEYQKALENLVATDCKAEPENFYDNLVETRKKRKVVAGDTARLRKLVTRQVTLVEKLKGSL